jgi:hypothetical protein
MPNQTITVDIIANAKTAKAAQEAAKDLAKVEQAEAKANAGAANAAKAAASASETAVAPAAAAKNPQTWKEFVGERMGPYMKSEGGHNPAIKKIGEEWRVYKAQLEAAAAKEVKAVTGNALAETATASRAKPAKVPPPVTPPVEPKKITSPKAALRAMAGEDVMAQMAEEKARKRLTKFETEHVFGFDAARLMMAVAGATLLGNELARVTGEVRAIKNEWGELDTTGKVVKIGEALPVIGAFVKAGQDIREIILGEQAEIDGLNKSTKVNGALWEERRGVIRETLNILREHEAALARINVQIKTAGMAPTAAGIAQERAAAEEEVKAAQQKADDAKLAMTGAPHSKAIEEASARIHEVRKQIQELNEITHNDEMGMGLIDAVLANKTSKVGSDGIRREMWSDSGIAKARGLISQEAQLTAGRAALVKAFEEKRTTDEKTTGERLQKEKDKQAKGEQEIARASGIRIQDIETQTAQERLKAAADHEKAIGEEERSIRAAADAELLAMRRELQKQEEQLDHDRKNGAPKEALAEQEKAIELAREKIKTAEAKAADDLRKAGEERAAFQARTDAEVAESQAKAAADRLHQQGKDYEAGLELLKASHDKRITEINEAEKRELKEHSAADAERIRAKYKGLRAEADLTEKQTKDQFDINRARAQRDIAELSLEQQRRRVRSTSSFFDTQEVQAGSSADYVKQQDADNMRNAVMDANQQLYEEVKALRGATERLGDILRGWGVKAG